MPARGAGKGAIDEEKCQVKGRPLTVRVATLGFVIIPVGMVERKMLIQAEEGCWPQEQKSARRGGRVPCAICMAIH